MLISNQLYHRWATESIGLRRILKLLEAASEDKKIKGILIENNSVGVGQATILSLMTGLEKFKQSGKFIYSSADSWTCSLRVCYVQWQTRCL